MAERRRRGAWARRIGLIAIAGLAVAGCGGGDGDSSGDTGDTADASATTVTTSAKGLTGEALASKICPPFADVASRYKATVEPFAITQRDVTPNGDGTACSYSAKARDNSRITIVTIRVDTYADVAKAQQPFDLSQSRTNRPVLTGLGDQAVSEVFGIKVRSGRRILEIDAQHYTNGSEVARQAAIDLARDVVLPVLATAA